MIEGILLQELISDAMLPKYARVIVDEDYQYRHDDGAPENHRGQA